MDALYFITPLVFFYDESIQNVCDVVHDSGWDVDKLRELLPKEFANHILENIKPPVVQGVLVKSYCILDTKGEFSVKYSCEYLRKRHEPCNAYKKLWVKGLSFKISFFMWNV